MVIMALDHVRDYINFGYYLNYAAFVADNERLENKMFQHIIIHEFFADDMKYFLKKDSSNSSTSTKIEYIFVDTSITKDHID